MNVNKYSVGSKRSSHWRRRNLSLRQNGTNNSPDRSRPTKGLPSSRIWLKEIIDIETRIIVDKNRQPVLNLFMKLNPRPDSEMGRKAN
jgi:hypothetical protein